MTGKSMAREIFTETIVLRDGLIAQSRLDGCLYVLKPANSFIDEKVVDWLADSWHTGVPRCVGRTTDSADRRYFVFEYIQGKSLDHMLEATGRMSSPGYLLSLMLQWAQILSFLHQRCQNPLLHLDIKPANMIVDEQGKAGLIDFTTARILNGKHPDDDTRARKCLTPNYAAPELARGAPCPGSDLYALGLSVLVGLTGLKPAACRSQPLRDILGEAPAALQTLFARCLHTDPALRHAHAEALAYDIRQLLCEGDLQEDKTADSACRRHAGLLVENVQPAAAQASAEHETAGETPAGEKVAGQAPSGQSLPEETAPEAKDKRLPAVLLCIWDGAACGCEMAAVLAEHQDVLVIDADLLNPRADLLLGRHNQFYREPADGERGLDLAFQAEQQSRLSPQLLQKLARETAVPRVRLLDCLNQLEDYEYCHLDSLFQILKWARFISDIVVVLCNRSIFDAFTCLCIMAADQVVVPLGGSAGDFRERNRAVTFLVERYKVRLARFSYVAFPYDRKNDLSQGTMNELCDGHLRGCISDLALRRSRACHATPYAAVLSDKTRHEYRRLIHSMGMHKMRHKEA